MSSISSAVGISPVPLVAASEVNQELNRLQSIVDQALAEVGAKMGSGNYHQFSMALLNANEVMNQHLSFIIANNLHRPSIEVPKPQLENGKRVHVLNEITQSQVNARENIRKDQKTPES